MSYMFVSILALVLTFIYAPIHMIISPFLPPEPPEVPHVPEITTITVEGVRYKNCFLDENLWFVEKHDFSTKNPDYTTTSSEYYKIENNWLYVKSDANEEYDLSEKLYCPEEDWEELKAYYSNPENYYYQCKAIPRYVSEDTYVEGDFITITVTDGETFKKLLVEESDIRASDSNSVISITSNEEHTLFRFKRTSKNELFCKQSSTFTVYKGTAYHRGGQTGNYTTLYKIKDEIQEYISGLLKNNGYEALFE
ncbi:MAG: hypothetical protein IJZ07_08100 [Clostridia bacterium]|nr:hypothetical protein [Clostridia bacterium]